MSEQIEMLPRVVKQFAQGVVERLILLCAIDVINRHETLQLLGAKLPPMLDVLHGE